VLGNSRISKCLWCGTLIAVLCLLSAAHLFAAGNDKVLARVGNETVTDNDLKEMVNVVPENFRRFYETPEGRKKTLDYVVNIYVLSAEAEKQGIDKKPEVARLLNFTKKDLLARLYLDSMSKNDETPTDAEAKAFYEQNKSQYAVPESAHLHHILVKTEKEAKDVLARLKKGDKFADVASQVSICPSKAKGGNLEWLPRGSLVKEIEDVAFTMKDGDITGPVQSKFGYHVLFLEEKKPAQESTLTR